MQCTLSSAVHTKIKAVVFITVGSLLSGQPIAILSKGATILYTADNDLPGFAERGKASSRWKDGRATDVLCCDDLGHLR